MHSFLVVSFCLAPVLIAGQRIEVRMNTDQAQAMLRFAAGMGEWDSVAATEGYVRLKQRETHIGSAISDDAFRTFAVSEQLRRRAPTLQAVLARWSQTDVNQIAIRVLAYVPPQARIHATIYVVLKPRSNNFVFEASTNPAIFVSLDPADSPEEFENTVAHELHHIGLASLADHVERAYATLMPNVRAASEWLGAFGEGIAMLAAAGSPGIHPHQYSSPRDRARWDRAMAGLAVDLRKVEAFLLDIARGQLNAAQQRERGMAFFDVQGPWYTVGWKMAATVEVELGRPALIACMPDLRLLLVRYNEAAQRLKLPRWSAQLITELGTP